MTLEMNRKDGKDCKLGKKSGSKRSRAVKSDAMSIVKSDAMSFAINTKASNQQIVVENQTEQLKQTQLPYLER